MTKKNLAVYIFALVVAIFFSAAALPAQQPDARDCKDHPLFKTRMPEYRIGACKVEAFGVYEFFVTKGAKVPVEGKFTFITYNFSGQRANEPSGLAVVRNYENAIRNAGGTILQSDPQRWVNGKIVNEGREVWVQAEKGNGTIWLRIVEKQAMEQFVVADAAALGQGINATGHVAVYGIYFDTAKATIKAESAAAIAEVAKLLKNDPKLKVFVVGHTDNEGTVDGNIALSQARGEAVLQALVGGHGIAAARLRAAGCGQFSPLASNDSPEGRARNRRVELVKQ